MKNDDEITFIKLLCEIAPILAKYGEKNDEAWAAYSRVVNYIHVREKIMLGHHQESGSA